MRNWIKPRDNLNKWGPSPIPREVVSVSRHDAGGLYIINMLRGARWRRSQGGGRKRASQGARDRRVVTKGEITGKVKFFLVWGSGVGSSASGWGRVVHSSGREEKTPVLQGVRVSVSVCMCRAQLTALHSAVILKKKGDEALGCSRLILTWQLSGQLDDRKAVKLQTPSLFK